jgi:S1-C subfamily serine protease
MNIPSVGIRVVAGDNTGVRIVNVEAGSVAGKAGLHSGDVINDVDGASIKTPTELAAQLSSRVSGAKVRVRYLLHGQWQAEVILTLGESR